MSRILVKQLIREAVEDAALEKELQDLAKDIATGIEQKGEELDESAIALILGAVLAIPAIVDGFGSLVKLISKLAGSQKGEVAADKILKAGHRVEGWFLKPVKWALKKAKPEMDETKIEEFAHLIHKSVIFICLLLSGIGFVAAVKKAQMSTAAAEGVLAAIKGTELARFVSAKM